jgi:hypothetical protein
MNEQEEFEFRLRLERENAAAAPAKKQLAWSDVPFEAAKNIPSSAGNFLGGIYQAVRHPLDTAGNVLDMAAGGLRNALPESIGSVIDKADINQDATKRAVKAADAAGAFFKGRYGSAEGIKNTLATDPVGVASDLSTVVTGGASLAAKIPQTARLAQALRTGAQAVNPLAAASSAISTAVPAVGRGAANLIGGLGTHTGGESLQQAARSGFAGGASAKSFADNMRGNVPMTDVLDAAKSNLEEMGRAKSAEYRAGMAQVSGDQSVLNFNGIDSAVQNAANTVSFKGQVKNVKAAGIQQKISDEVNNWKSLDPAEFHTPEGLDALKQKVGGIVESIPFEEKTARMVGGKVYNAIKAEIVKQAPVYADTMKGYAEASDQIKEIERALSLGGKASVDTAMRKLQSLTRNNVNTNYGNRLDLAKQLAQQGGTEIMPALAGQALSSWTPRGLGSAVAGGMGMGAYALAGAPTAAATLALQSPRLMGEAALKTGQLAKLLKTVGTAPARALNGTGIDPVTLANALYQAGRLPQQ